MGTKRLLVFIVIILGVNGPKAREGERRVNEKDGTERHNMMFSLFVREILSISHGIKVVLVYSN